MAKEKILITGGAGFIGSHLCQALASDHEIVVFDSLKRDSLKNSPAHGHANIHLIQGDIRNRADVAKAVGDCEVIIHCAAIAGIDSVGRSPLDTMDVNLMGSHNLLDVARDRKIKRFIQFSTSEVYGPYIYKGTESDLTSQGPVGQMRWTYAVSKLAAEHYAFCFHRQYNLPVVSVRPFNVYGPGQVGEGAIQKFIKSAVENKDIEMYGDGTQIRAWCYISDFVDAILRCLKTDEAVGNAFNIGNPQTGIAIQELAQLVIALANSSSKIIWKKALSADVEVRVPSIEKAQKMLGFKPKVNLAEGIRNTIDWFRRQK